MPSSTTSFGQEKIVFEALLFAWLILTAGGVYWTFSHRAPPVLSSLAYFSYGMLAPYQKDSDINVDLAVAAWDTPATSRLLSIEKYFPGIRGERNSRMRLEQSAGDGEQEMARQYELLLTQILLHERQQGHQYVRLDLYAEEWPRSPQGYDFRRMESKRTFITSVR